MGGQQGQRGDHTQVPSEAGTRGVTRLTLHAGGGARKQASYCHSPVKGGRSGPEERWAQARLTCPSWTAPACFNTPEPCWEPPTPRPNPADWLRSKFMTSEKGRGEGDVGWREGLLFTVGDTGAHLYPTGNDPGEKGRWVTWDSRAKRRNRVLGKGRWTGSEHMEGSRDLH